MSTPCKAPGGICSALLRPCPSGAKFTPTHDSTIRFSIPARRGSRRVAVEKQEDEKCKVQSQYGKISTTAVRACWRRVSGRAGAIIHQAATRPQVRGYGRPIPLGSPLHQQTRRLRIMFTMTGRPAILSGASATGRTASILGERGIRLIDSRMIRAHDLTIRLASEAGAMRARRGGKT